MLVNVDFEAELFPVFHMSEQRVFQEDDDDRLVDIPQSVWDRYQANRRELQKIADEVTLIRAGQKYARRFL